jgi:hypothetical protein
MYFISFYSTKNEIWKIENQNKEVVIGMLCLWNKISTYFIKKYVVKSNVTLDNVICEKYSPENISVLSSYITEKYKYYCWTIDLNMNIYKLVGFNSVYFFQGFITLSNYFKLDFRRFLYGLIFDSDQHLYYLYNYGMTEIDYMDFEKSQIYEEDKNFDIENTLNVDNDALN